MANETVYAVDVALHIGELNYGRKEETADRVIKKTVSDKVDAAVVLP